MAPIALSVPIAAFPTSFSSSSFSRYNVKPRNSRLLQSGGLKINNNTQRHRSIRNRVVTAMADYPTMEPTIHTPHGLSDLGNVLFRNRTIFICTYIGPEVAEHVISELVTFSTMDEDSDITMYLNCEGGSVYSTLAIYDCMNWIKPKVSTIGFGSVGSTAALILAGGERGLRYCMPNTRVLIHQPTTSIGEDPETIRHQLNTGMQNRHRIDMMYSAFTGRSLEQVEKYTELNSFLTAGEALDFGLIDKIIDTTY